MAYAFDLKGFKGCTFRFSNYENGNVKIEVFQGSTLLLVLTEDMTSKLANNYFVMKQNDATRGMIKHLTQAEVLHFWTIKEYQGQSYYICGLENDISMTNTNSIYGGMRYGYGF